MYNYQCFFCGRPTRENQGVCATHERKLLSPGATGLRTRPLTKRQLKGTAPSVDSPIPAR